LGKIIFITGTDTGVGKTLLTGLLLCHLRQTGIHALAVKPFCSGGRADAELLYQLQDGEIDLSEVNRFHFKRAVAPGVLAESNKIALGRVVEALEKTAHKCECLLVEGIGGLMVPLGKNFFVRDLIGRLECEVLVVSRNQLGTLNHTILTVQSLKQAGILRQKVVLMGQQKRDFSAQFNEIFLRKALAPIGVMAVRFLGAGAGDFGVIRGVANKSKKVLARLVG
jgi:dethiobiotin synthetase